MNYPCPFCKTPVIWATQPNFEQLPVHLRKRRIFDIERVQNGTWVLKEYDIPAGEFPAHKTWYYREKRNQDSQPLWQLHDCKKEKK